MADKGLMRPCKACGRNLWIVKGPNGKSLPLDLESHVYEVSVGAAEGAIAQRINAYVTHFASCTKANEFSGGRGRAEPPPAPAQQDLGIPK